MNEVLNVILSLTREYGRCEFDIAFIAENCNLPERSLYDYNTTTGILIDLDNSGYVVLSNYGRSPTVCLDSSVLC